MMRLNFDDSSSSSIARPSPAVVQHHSRYHVSRTAGQIQSHDDLFLRSTVMAQFLYRRFQEQGWLQLDRTAETSAPLGIVIRIEEQAGCNYIAEPRGVDDSLKVICAKLNVAAVATMSSDITSAMFSRIGGADSEITLLPNNITVPIINSLYELTTEGCGVRRRDFCCFVRQEKTVLIWSNSADAIMLNSTEVESKLMSCIWGAPILEKQPAFSQHSLPQSNIGTPKTSTPSVRAPSIFSSPSAIPTYATEKTFANTVGVDLEAEDKESQEAPSRPFLLSHSVMVGLAMCLLVIIESLAARLIVIEIKALGKVALPRLAILASLPVFMWFTLFFTIVVVGTVFQILGPINDVTKGNSRYYSARPPDIYRHRNIEFPHITIQMPVYKEGLKGVIIPTINSLIPAIRHYESLGGTASIYVCEDGMQTLKPEVAEMRQAFYRANDIGWCARPPHSKDGFQRAGKFKKASNMNYCLRFSLRVEDELLKLMKIKSRREGRTQEEFSIEEEEELYQEALRTIIASDEGKTWAEGNVRMGDIILIIDCDTRVPEDCLSLGAMEMEESPEVAIIQHASGVMQVVHSVFENASMAPILRNFVRNLVDEFSLTFAVTYFTNLVYLLIKFSVGSGDCAPFVGHNAFLRWKAIQSVSFQEDGIEKFWSESHVSEDFDMSLRLQTSGFVVRLSTYDHGEFKEGVSLTAFDELLRWEKYSYGCSEMIFHPVYQWIYRGPFTKLFIDFLRSNIKISAKFTILGYIGTYYAIGAALPLSVTNYFLTGWIADSIDHSYLPSWDMLCGTLFIFLLVSPLAFAWYRHRIGQKNFFWAALEAFTWMPFFFIFFGGLSWHISYALLAHMFCLPIEWSSTAKELDSGGFFVGIERVWKTFKFVLVFMFLLSGGMIYLSLYAPVGWRITEWTSIIPVANQVVGHVLLPVFTILF